MGKYCKYYKQKKQASYDYGVTWIDVTPKEYRMGELYERNSADCGYTGILERWVNSGTTCSGHDEYYNQVKQTSSDGGITWVTTSSTKLGELIERNSTDCGYVISPSQYLTFYNESTNTDAKIYFERYNGDISYYSLDNGTTWSAYTYEKNGQIQYVQVPRGGKVLWKGNLIPSSDDGIGTFSSSVNYSVEGNPMSLLYGDDFSNKRDLSNYPFAFYRLFRGSDNLISAKKLILPATTLSRSCYSEMFMGCHILKYAPLNLPATTLTESCYGYMFNYCKALGVAPELPATVMGGYCYENMFEGCSGLTTVNVFSATTLADGCCVGMFRHCWSLITFPSKLPATTLVYESGGLKGCYEEMFYDCKSLITAPELPATTLVKYCYKRMFYNCEKLNYVRCFAEEDEYSSPPLSQTGWLYNVSPTGLFVKASNASWADGAPGIPSGWTVQSKTSSPQYRTDSGETYCVGFDKYVDLYSQVSYNNGSTWYTTATTTTFVQSNCNVCGFNQPYCDEYLTFTAIDAGKFQFSSNYVDRIKYSLDSGATWTTLSANTYTPTISAGSKIMWKGDFATQTYFDSTGRFTAEGNIMSLLYGDYFSGKITLRHPSDGNNKFSYMFASCTGLTNAENLILPATTLSDDCYAMMFSRCENLTKAPKVLPASKLANNCYNGMFNGCSSLTTCPSLPATTLAQGCYSNMFGYCTSLTTAPELPATTLAQSCYYMMFYNCTSLNSITCLATDISASNCTYNWVKNVAASGTFKKAASMNDWTTGINGIPSGWTIINTFEPLISCYSNIVTITCSTPNVNIYYRLNNSGSYSAYTTPISITADTIVQAYSEKDGLRSNTVSQTCQYIDPLGQPLTFIAQEGGTFKFIGNSINYSLDDGNTWTSLASDTNSPTVSAGNKIMWKATLTPAQYDGIGRFSSSGNFTVEGNAMSLLYGDNFSGKTSLSGVSWAFASLFANCSGLTSAENLILPATNLVGAQECYEGMFFNCTSLTAAPTLPATNLSGATYCYRYMFQGCTSLTTAPQLPATALAVGCYDSMFYNCISLTAAPSLPATTLANYCYNGMFYNCTSLTTAPVLPATTLAVGCYDTMFAGCGSLTTAPSLPATTLANYCYQYMFYSCTSLNNITCLATDISASNCTYNWVSGVASSGTFTKAASMNSWTTGINGIPSGWTVQNA